MQTIYITVTIALCACCFFLGAALSALSKNTLQLQIITLKADLTNIIDNYEREAYRALQTAISRAKTNLAIIEEDENP